MEIKLVIRKTEDWQNLKRKDYINSIYNNPNCKLGSNVRMRNLENNLQGWDKLNLDIFDYRQRIKNIAMSHWPHNIEWVSLENALENKSSNIIYIPIDDDDILNSDVIDKLYDVYKNSDIKSVIWKTWTYSVLNDRPVFFRLSDHALFVPSNCYSIRGDYITKDYLVQHSIFSNNFQSYNIIDKEYGLILHHPASTFKIQNKYLIDKIEVKDINVPPQLQWCKSFIDDINILTRKLYDK